MLLSLATLNAAAWLCSGWRHVDILEGIQLNAPAPSDAQLARPYPYHPVSRSNYVTLPRASMGSGSIRFCLIWVRDDGATKSGVTIQRRHRSWYWTKHDLNLKGSSVFEWRLAAWKGTVDFDRLDAALPVWVPSVALGVPGGCLLWSSIRARRRAQHGHCNSCGYNLAGLAFDVKCPECGKPKTQPQMNAD